MKTIQFIIDLWFLEESDEYIFDFENAGKVEPFTLLFLSSEIKHFRDYRPNKKFTGINIRKMQEAADMGFFRAIGIEYGDADPNWEKSLTAIPIRIFSCNDMIRNAENIGKPVGEYLTGRATSLTHILTRTDSGDLFDTLQYSIREILRNVVEHSESNQFGFCAQHWPEKKKVSLAILDRGIGLRQSLAQNPHLSVLNDTDAVKLAIQPGISGKAYNGAKIDETNIWANSGYGLFMTSQICKLGGSFVLTSGSKGVFLSETHERLFDIRSQGTALNLTLSTDKLESLSLMLTRLRESDVVKNAPLTPSTASLGK
jgi:hypothetical protein